MQLTDFGKPPAVQQPPSAAFDAALLEGDETPDQPPESELVGSSDDFDSDDAFNSLDENDKAIWNRAARAF